MATALWSSPERILHTLRLSWAINGGFAMM